MSQRYDIILPGGRFFGRNEGQADEGPYPRGTAIDIAVNVHGTVVAAGSPGPVWPEGMTSGYHDPSCLCDAHCGYCFEDLGEVRQIRVRMANQGLGGYYPLLHPLARYCCDHCKAQAKAERALDRRLAAVTVKRQS